MDCLGGRGAVGVEKGAEEGECSAPSSLSSSCMDGLCHNPTRRGRFSRVKGFKG